MNYYLNQSNCTRAEYLVLCYIVVSVFTGGPVKLNNFPNKDKMISFPAFRKIVISLPLSSQLNFWRFITGIPPILVYHAI